MVPSTYWTLTRRVYLQQALNVHLEAIWTVRESHCWWSSVSDPKATTVGGRYVAVQMVHMGNCGGAHIYSVPWGTSKCLDGQSKWVESAGITHWEQEHWLWCLAHPGPVVLAAPTFLVHSRICLGNMHTEVLTLGHEPVLDWGTRGTGP